MPGWMHAFADELLPGWLHAEAAELLLFRMFFNMRAALLAHCCRIARLVLTLVEANLRAGCTAGRGRCDARSLTVASFNERLRKRRAP